MTNMDQRSEWVAIDVYAAEQHSIKSSAMFKAFMMEDELHYIANDERVRDGFGRSKWAMDLVSVWNILIGMVAEGDDYTAERVATKVEEFASLCVTANDAAVEIAWADEMYEGWSRFFLVINNNGHIHSSLNCSTCYATTKFNWLPELSGLTEGDAVEQHGAILCTVCFPTAPVEWTNGERKVNDGRCEGWVFPLYEGRGTRYGVCSCGKREVSILADGKPRKHTPWGEKERAKELKREAREAKDYPQDVANLRERLARYIAG